MFFMIAPCISGWFSHCFRHKPTFNSSLSLNVCHSHSVGTPLGNISYLMRGMSYIWNPKLFQLQSAVSLLHRWCGIDNQLEHSSTIHKATISPVFPNKVFEGNDICRMCYSGKFREYKIITCNYGNFCKGNHLNLFPLRNRIALLIAFESF